MAARLAALVLVVLVLAPSAAARRGPTPLVGKLPPQGLKAFLLRADEPAGRTFSRTPSFAWSPVRGAVKYEFELSTSKRFTENAVIYSAKTLKTPVAAVPISLPWTTGADYSLFAHVRAVTGDGVTAWSSPYGFTMRWPSVPKPLEPSYPGLIRWTPISGANAYMVWFVDVNKWFTTLTNVADERELYTFHQSQAWTGSVRWRVRAVRWLYGSTENGVPAVSYGPWSPIYTSTNPPFATGPLTANAAVSDVVSNALQPQPHELMPGFVFSGNRGLDGRDYELYHVYAFTDSDCLNMVYRSAIVGSPAYAPRPTGPLKLPTTLAELDAARLKYLPDGQEGTVWTAEHIGVTSSEVAPATAAPAPGDGGQSSTGGTGAAGTSLPVSQIVNGAKVDLWDTDWPTGRYYWTVVPVKPVAIASFSTTLAQPVASGATSLRVGDASGFKPGQEVAVGSASAGETVTITAITGSTLTIAGGVTAAYPAGTPVVLPGGIEYQDTELTQDACASGRMLTFGKTSQPVLTGSTAPYVSGLSPKGTLFAAKRARPMIYGTPLVTWEPAFGADYYEVQWSKRLDPWVPVGSLQTAGTAVTLPLPAGTWYYRVRGMNTYVPGGKPQMSWSDEASFQIARPKFRVIKR